MILTTAGPAPCFAVNALSFLAPVSGLIFSGTVFYPLLATEAFHLNGGGYGALVAAFGLGALPGALLAARSKGHPSGRVVLVLAAALAGGRALWPASGRATVDG